MIILPFLAIAATAGLVCFRTRDRWYWEPQTGGRRQARTHATLAEMFDRD